MSSLPLIHPADFSNSHIRHWRDAEFLFGAKRWANADQLYGFSAECGLKAVMVTNGLSIDGKGSPRAKKYKTHINDLWDAFHAFIEGRQTGNLLQHLPRSNPFRVWSHHNRYASGSHFDKNAVGQHRDAARQVHRFYLRLKVNGHV